MKRKYKCKGIIPSIKEIQKDEGVDKAVDISLLYGNLDDYKIKENCKSNAWIIDKNGKLIKVESIRNIIK